VTRRVMAFLLRLAPRAFRERKGEEILAVHREREARITGGGARFGFGVREGLGMAWLVTRLHMGRRSGTGERGGATMFETTGQDVQYAVRTLWRNPGFATVAVVVLALGIGANAAIFSAVNAFFFRPLPFAESGRLVTLFETNPEFGWVDASAAPANMLDWREQVEAFDDISAYSEFSPRTSHLLSAPCWLNSTRSSPSPGRRLSTRCSGARWPE
jgi:hypothetical protein